MHAFHNTESTIKPKVFGVLIEHKMETQARKGLKSLHEECPDTDFSLVRIWTLLTQ